MKPTHASTISKHSHQIVVDRLTVCFSDENSEHVEVTCGLLLSDKYTKGIPGLKMTKNARYKVSAQFLLPLSGGGPTHPVYFEAGPHQPGISSYRLDFNPSKLSSDGWTDLIALLNSIIDADPAEFFSYGRVTRIDAAIDMPGQILDDLIVLHRGKKKHGVYSDQFGTPETVYLGTPRSNRVVTYTKKIAGAWGLRIECRVKPKCLGKELVSLSNPFRKVQLLSVDAFNALLPGTPAQVLADTIRLRGTKAALHLFPSAERKIIEKAIASAAAEIPDMTEMWAAWPNALSAAGLSKLLAFPQLPKPSLSEAA